MERGRELLRVRERERLRLSRVPLAGAGALLRERDCEASRGVTERACDLDRASSGVGERPRDGLRLSDMLSRVLFQVRVVFPKRLVNVSREQCCLDGREVECLVGVRFSSNFTLEELHSQNDVTRQAPDPCHRMHASRVHQGACHLICPSIHERVRRCIKASLALPPCRSHVLLYSQHSHISRTLNSHPPQTQSVRLYASSLGDSSTSCTPQVGHDACCTH